MKRGDAMVRHRLDRHRMNRLVAKRFQQPLGVGAVGFVAPYVGADIVRREKGNLMPELLEMPGPVVRSPTRLEDDCGGRTLGEKPQEPGT